MNNYYLQFYRKSSLLYNDIDFYTEFMNGLSHVKPADGEYIWTDQAVTKMPVNKGNVYASVWYKQTAVRLYEIAKENPDLNIFVGGPICFHYDLTLKRDNYHVIRQDASYYWPNSEWHLTLPEVHGDIGYSVSLVKGVGCYWGKCNFCKQIGSLSDRNVDHIPVIQHEGHKYIWLHSFAMSPRMMKMYYPTFEDRQDVNYSTYIRADRAITKTYKIVKPKLKIDPKYLGFNVGIEFPSNHMLTYMDKGATVEDYLEFIKITNDSQLHFNLIIGWKNTTWQDVKEVEKFLNELSKITKPNTITVNLYSLVIVENRFIWDDYKDDKILWYHEDKSLLDKYNDERYASKCQENTEFIWDQRMGEPVLSKDQYKIKRELRNLYHAYPWLSLHDWTNDKLY